MVHFHLKFMLSINQGTMSEELGGTMNTVSTACACCFIKIFFSWQNQFLLSPLAAGRHLLTLWPISLWKKGTAVLFSGIKFHPFYTTISPCYLCMKEWIRKGWNSALMSFKVRRIHSVKISVIVSCYRCIIFGFFLASNHPFAVIELFSAI